MIYRELVIHYGLWDQLRVDQGKEWHLMLFIQEQLAHLRTNTNRAPHSFRLHQSWQVYVVDADNINVTHVFNPIIALNRTIVLKGCGWK